jgi:FdhD protein
MPVSGITRVSRWQGGAADSADDIIAGEVPVALTYNKLSHVVMMATPADLEDFALGFSLTEGILKVPELLLATHVIPREQGIEVAMTVPPDIAEDIRGRRRNLTGRTGCGLCGAETLEQALRYPSPVGTDLRVSHAALQTAIDTLTAHQPLQAATGAVHGTAFCNAQGEVLAAREDVGRHNALDKLIGHLFRSGIDPLTGFAMVSSRASYEMVYKTAAAGIQLMVAVSAPTTLAVEFAMHCGLTLIGFARPGRHNIYTHPERVTD